MEPNKLAIATITDTSFIRGTVVLLYSFLQNNQWFKGDIIILENNDLDEECKKELSFFPNIKYHKVGDDLLKRLDILCYFLPTYQKIRRRFYSLEAFNLKGYDSILFLDSDILCCGDVKSLIQENKYPLLAAPDYQYYLGKKRDKQTFLPIDNTGGDADNKISLNVFNSGVMLINRLLLFQNTYIELLKLLTPIVYKNIITSHTDQYLLNLFFENQVKFTDYKYNYLLHAKEAIDEKKKGQIKDIIFLHYSKKNKPWFADVDLNDSFIQLWNKEYQEIIALIKNEHLTK